MAGMNLMCFTLEQQRILVTIIDDMVLLQARVDALMRRCRLCGYYKSSLEMGVVACKECDLYPMVPDGGARGGNPGE